MADIDTEISAQPRGLEARPFVKAARRSLATLTNVGPLARVTGRWLGGSDQTEIIQESERRGVSLYLVSFVLLVIAPTLIAGVYFAFIASDQFYSESRFAVTSSRYEMSERAEKSKLSANGLPSVASDDVYIISAYIHSQAAVDEISRTIDLREIFRRPEADFFARLKANASIEELTAYWQSMVTVYVDATSGIVTVGVRAFRRDDALQLCEAIVKASENLANSVSARARQYTMKLAESEVVRAEKRVAASLADLREFRGQVGFIDPNSQARASGTILTELLSDRIKLQNEYFASSQAMSKDAPTVQTMKSRLDSLDSQIAQERAKMAGNTSETATIASLMPKYESLELQNRFAEKVYSLAEDGLERARIRSEAQSIYVNSFVPPLLPQEAQFPQRLFTTLAFGAVLIVLWGIGAMTVAVVEDHRI